jgi:hypothetical protein
MAPVFSPREVRKWVEQALAERPDMGLKKAIANVILEAPSPFDQQARRKARTGFVLGAILLAAAAICFCYFNLAG